MSDVFDKNPDIRELEKLHYETLLTPEQKRKFYLKNIPKVPPMEIEKETWFEKYFVIIFMVSVLLLGTLTTGVCIYDIYK